tara:strand:- start:3087 stop:3494 length:408 start_codon:yes stop_codon:yes gene_type:complete
MTSTQSSSLSFTSSFKTSSSRKQRQQQQQRRRRAYSLNNVVVKAASTNNEFVSALNAKFAIPTSVSFFDDECDETSSSPYVSLTHKNGSTAKVYLFGANCASWTQPTGDEVLFVRPDAKFDESVPIAGESFVVSI